MTALLVMALFGYYDAPTRTAPETFRHLGVSDSCGWRAVARGEIPGVLRIGRRVLVSTAAVRSWLGDVGPPEHEDAPAGTGASS